MVISIFFNYERILSLFLFVILMGIFSLYFLYKGYYPFQPWELKIVYWPKHPFYWDWDKNESCCLWKLVTFFGKEYINWFSISGVMIGRSWTIKSIIFLVNFSKSTFWLYPVTIFHGKQDGIIHFCLSVYEISIFGTLNLHFDKKMDFFKLDFSTSSYHKSINIGPIGIFFTKNEHFFSPAFQICQERCNLFNN